MKSTAEEDHEEEPSSPSSGHAGLKFHEVFQLKNGRYSDLPADAISEMLKSNSLDSASTQSLLTVVHGILDESTDKRSGEMPQRVACLLKKVVQEVERRISSQSEYIRNQNNLIRVREEKYHSRIRLLETLVSGTSEETKIIMEQLQQIKIEKNKIEELKSAVEQDVSRLLKERDASCHKISELELDLDTMKKSNENQCQQLEAETKVTKLQLKANIEELECLLAESRKKSRDLEELSESKYQIWNDKQHMFQNIMDSQLQRIKDLKASSLSIKTEVSGTKESWNKELYNLGKKLETLTDAAENYHVVLAENRKLFNEVQELKGNIRVYCRIRPFLSGENRKSTTIEYIGDNGELLLANPSKQGKDGNRTFKFNKVFSPAATQEEVFLDIQPLIRSVLDGYNVCIFAYGQTGSGKTYTMTGPNSSSEEDWGVNFRALNDLFHISRNRRTTITYEIGVQMVEIYNEQVRDLLVNDTSQKKLGVLNTSLPNGLAVPDASMHLVCSTSDVLELMHIGLANRAVGATALNERSSRSHSVVTIHVRGDDLKTGATLRASLHLVDLAGSERVDRSEVTGDRLREAQHINKSLSALGDVIFALSQKSSHVPYRNSKLTQVLQSSLGGQAKTLMFVQINPDVKSYSETLSTLKFAERTSGVELGAARSSKESKDVRDLMEQLAVYKETIARKDEEIQRLQSLTSTGNSSRISEIHNKKSVKHSPSSPGLSVLCAATKAKGRLFGQKRTVPSNKASSDPGNSPDLSDRHSETSSLQSMDGFRVQKEGLGGEERVQSYPADIEYLGFGEADSVGKLSERSDSGLSLGAETEGSVNSVSTEGRKDTKVVPSQVPKPTSQKGSNSKSTRSTLKGTFSKLKQNFRSSSSRSSTSQPKGSSTKSAKRWQ